MKHTKAFRSHTCTSPVTAVIGESALSSSGIANSDTTLRVCSALPNVPIPSPSLSTNLPPPLPFPRVDPLLLRKLVIRVVRPSLAARIRPIRGGGSSPTISICLLNSWTLCPLVRELPLSLLLPLRPLSGAPPPDASSSQTYSSPPPDCAL